MPCKSRPHPSQRRDGFNLNRNHALRRHALKLITFSPIAQNLDANQRQAIRFFYWHPKRLRISNACMTQTLTLRRPDDFHLHLRDGAMLQSVLPETTRHFARALIMPNLIPPVVTAQDARAYRDRILAAVPAGADFKPLMTLYLTEQSDPDDIARAFEEGLIVAVKLYPAGATTNSTSGVGTIEKVQPVLDRMAEIGLPLCVHGEVTTHDVDIFDREAVFIDTVLDPTRRRTPGLKVIMEHITTSDAADYLRAGDETLAATITTHHLMINRNHMLVGGIRPHYYCLPVVKRREHQEALVALATSGFDRVFLGTDSAPHLDGAKETACGCAGVFSATNTMSCLADVFEKADALGHLNAYTSENGARFYGLPLNDSTLTLTKGDPAPPPGKLPTPDGALTIFDPGHPLHWHVD